MHRIIYVIPVGGGFPIFGYGLLLMLGFAAGLVCARLRAKRSGVSADAVMDVAILSVVAGLVGARLAFLLFDYEPEGGGLAEWFAIWRGGLTFQGGLFLALAAGFAYLRYRKISFARIADVFAPGLAFGVGLGRVGCFLNGCCWGKPSPSGFPFGMTFPEEAEAVQLQLDLAFVWPERWAELLARLGHPAGMEPPLPLYPTQIASALGLFAIGAGLILAERKWPRLSDGQTMIWFMFAYAVGRFCVEFWRDDTPLRYGFGAFPGLRLGQWLSLAMFAAAVVLQWWINRRAGKIRDAANPSPGESP